MFQYSQHDITAPSDWLLSPPPNSPPLQLAPPSDGPYDVTISPSSPPAFIASGGSFNLSCGASSWPAASFSWYREKQLLEHFQEVLPQEVLEVYGLKKPSASYICVATNSKTGRSVTSTAVTFGIVGELRRRLMNGITASWSVIGCGQ